MHSQSPISWRALAAKLVALALLLPAFAAAQTTAADLPGPWRYRASIYGYLPSLGGSTSAPANGGSSVDVDGDRLGDSLELVFMGAFEAHNGRWGVFTDVMYLDLGGDEQNSRDFTIGRREIPVGTTGNLDWNLKATIWTLAGAYRLPSNRALTADLIGGARMLRLKSSLRWDISGSIGSLAPADRSGSSERSMTVWDAIIGVKGRYTFGSGNRWSLPYYLDVGAGDSSLTWQAAAGLAYAFSWGDVSLAWRHIAYESKSGSVVQDLTFKGPMLGATFAF